MKCYSCEKFNECLNNVSLKYDSDGGLRDDVETEPCFHLKGVSEDIEPCFLCGSAPAITADFKGDIGIKCKKHPYVCITSSFPTTFSYAIRLWNQMIKEEGKSRITKDLDIIGRLRGCADWFRNHGRNTNTAVISVCEDAAEIIEMYMQKKS